MLSARQLSVASAVINSNEDGQLCDIFRVTTADKGKIPKEEWEPIKQQLLAVLSSSSRSSRPAIFGMVRRWRGPGDESGDESGQWARDELGQWHEMSQGAGDEWRDE